MTMMIAALVGTPLFPMIVSALTRSERDTAIGMYHWASKWAFVATLPAAAVMIAAPAPLLHVVFGGGFAAMSTPTRILGVACLVQVGLGFNGFTLEALGAVRLVAVRAITGIILSVALCVLLVPHFGASGAAIATTSAVSTVNVLSSASLKLRFGIAPWDVSFGITVLTGGIALACALFIPRAIGGISSCVLVAFTALAGAGIGSVIGHHRAAPSITRVLRG